VAWKNKKIDMFHFLYENGQELTYDFVTHSSRANSTEDVGLLIQMGFPVEEGVEKDAILNNNVKLLDILLTAIGNREEPDLFNEAVRYGKNKADLVRCLYEHGRRMVSFQFPTHEETIREAASIGNLECLKYFKQLGFDLLVSNNVLRDATPKCRAFLNAEVAARNQQVELMDYH
jgi:hypothetical protein